VYEIVKHTLPKTLFLALLVLGIVLTLSVVPSVFTVDDNNYLVNVLALRRGRVTIANTEGLRPSRELLFFDPTARTRAVEVTPVASTAPPLYAPLAVPFSVLGWRGLVALNTLAYLATILLVFHYARRHAAAAFTPWLAAGAFAFGGYTIEYALGLWPHALSFALCFAGIVAAGRAIENGRLAPAAAAGFLLALAIGIRYQNAVVLAAVGAGIVVWTRHRWRAVAAFALATAVPLSASAAINHERFDSWNPISKGPGYLDVPIAGRDRGAWVIDPAVMFWGQVVDYSARPKLTSVEVQSWLQHDPTTGAHLIFGVVVKKALLQSAPWVVLGLLLLLAAWVPAVRLPIDQRRQLRLLSLVAVAILATFSFAGVDRHDGLAFNARYFLELMPVVSVAFAWALDGRALKYRTIAIGAALGFVAVLVILSATPVVGRPGMPAWMFRQLAVLKTPLLLAVILAVAWLLTPDSEARRVFLSVTVGLCLGWGLMMHLGTDVLTSQAMRTASLARARAIAEVVPDRSAVIGHWGSKDAVGPLLLTRDIVVLDAWTDDGRDAPGLIRELLARERTVYVLEEGFTAKQLDRLVAGLHPTRVEQAPVPILELR